jgi:hypothetical protein
VICDGFWIKNLPLAASQGAEVVVDCAGTVVVVVVTWWPGKDLEVVWPECTSVDAVGRLVAVVTLGVVVELPGEVGTVVGLGE